MFANGYRYIQLKTNLKNEIQMIKFIKNLFKRHKQLNISVVRCSYNDVEKWCDENGYYIGTYWFPNR